MISESVFTFRDFLTQVILVFLFDFSGKVDYSKGKRKEVAP